MEHFILHVRESNFECFSFSSLLFVQLTKHRIFVFSYCCYKCRLSYCLAQIWRPSFAHFCFPLVFSTLFYLWVYSCYCYQFLCSVFIIFDPIKVPYLCKNTCFLYFTDSRYAG